MEQSQHQYERACWVALSQVPQVGPVRLAKLVEYFGSLSDAWAAPRGKLGMVVDRRTLSEIDAFRKTRDPEFILSELRDLHIDVITKLDSNYPRLLAHIPAAPPVLYVKGELVQEDDAAVAIVGTRRATRYGLDMAHEIASNLAQAGITVVSGLARGIDGRAHEGALAGSGRTIAVLASGVDVVYPPEHRQMAARVVESGALISDYPPGTKPDAQNFPARNRIISGMALGTLVVEAPRRSGALITVDFAADQGREVFTLPGNVTSRSSSGTNRLLRQGARAITSAEDILEDLGIPGVDHKAPPQQQPLDATDEERRIIALLGSQPQHVDEIAVAANTAAGETAALLTMLELKGIVRNTGAQHFVRTDARTGR